MTKPAPTAQALARACRAAVRRRYIATSCIETAFLFERTAHHLGLVATRVVCQVVAFSPAMAEALARGEDPNEAMKRPECWSVGVGVMQGPEDFVGRLDRKGNRFVGHVVCLAGDRLVDPSADQMSRPGKGLVIDAPIVARVGAKEGNDVEVITRVPSGAVVRYTLYPDIPPPEPKTNRILERTAKRLASELST